MKKVILILAFLILANTLVFSQSAGSTMYVSVKTTDLKSSTGTFATKLDTLNLGDAVTYLAKNGNWAEVKTSKNVTGWVNMSGLTTRRITSSGNSASAGEIALAGKGFSPDTEIEYKKGGLDYSGVDQMEKISISGPELQKFIEAGRLSKGN